MTHEQQRFIDHGNGTVTDTQSGLMWAKAPHGVANNSGSMDWTEAQAFCKCLSHAGYGDWRLPTVRELQSLIDYGRHDPALPAGHPFAGVRSSYYWSSNSLADDSDYAWYVDFYNGYVCHVHKTDCYCVWPVRTAGPDRIERAVCECKAADQASHEHQHRCLQERLIRLEQHKHRDLAEEIISARGFVTGAVSTLKQRLDRLEKHVADQRAESTPDELTGPSDTETLDWLLRSNYASVRVFRAPGRWWECVGSRYHIHETMRHEEGDTQWTEPDASGDTLRLDWLCMAVDRLRRAFPQDHSPLRRALYEMPCTRDGIDGMMTEEDNNQWTQN